MTPRLIMPRTVLCALIVVSAIGLLGLARAQDTATNAPATNMADTVKNLLAQSSQELADGDDESAIRDASTAIQLDPHNASAFELRGSIYIEEKLWDKAERDYNSAEKISPDVVYKYKLAEIKFLAKSYEDAQPRFAALESDANLGDLATFKAFLCDMLGYREQAALRDLAALDQKEHTQAFYFCHAAWDLYHSQRTEALKYFDAVDHLYDASANNAFVASLIECRRFQLAKASFVARDGTPYNQAPVFLEDDGLRVQTAKGWITLPLDQLPDDLSSLPEELREQIDHKRAVITDAPKPVSLVSFTTRSGKSYDNVRWSVGDDGLSVLTDDGWSTVPFADLPSDHSLFPDELQHAIEQKRPASVTTPDRTNVISFTTREGKIYRDAKAFLATDGLRVLTPDGWITVAFRDLPGDLSVFPSDWHARIQAGRTITPLDASGMAVISFTTKKGKHYDQVRAALGRTGLRLVTSEGWIEVPFNDLSKDVSAFPAEWRESISERETVTMKGTTPSP